jgi:hypothetical protein
MKIIITENQKKMLLREIKEDEYRNKIKNSIENSIEVSKKIYNDAKTKTGINLQFLLTWGAGIGGFVGPIESFLRGEYPELSTMEVTLILIGIISTHFIENKELNKNILGKIKESGLNQKFKKILKKSEELKEVFLNFIESLAVTVHKTTNMVSYAFILPVVTIVYDMVTQGKGIIDGANIIELVKRLTAFELLTVSGIMFRELLTRLINRFRSK